jgi:hypothetical protein
MAEIEPLINKSEIKGNFFDKCFCDRPHKFFMLYDPDMDELIIRLINPEKFASLFYLEDDLAVLVDLDSMQIVGFQISNFEAGYLSGKQELKDRWLSEHLADSLSHYQVKHYKPEPKRMPKPDRPRDDISNIYGSVCNELEMAFA